MFHENTTKIKHRVVITDATNIADFVNTFITCLCFDSG